MKYIRTKDGVYKNASTDKDIVIICKNRKLIVNPKDVINQADTIEELCNDFRFKDDNGKWDSFRIYDAFVKAIKDLGHVPELAFASIKPKINDHKLIDVAIMNDKGEWELI